MSEADKIIENLKKPGRKVEEFYTSNKTSDKNVANIEDDVKIVKEFIDYAQGVIDDMEYERPVDVTVYQKDLTSMKHILAEREQMLKERDVANDSVIAHKFAVMQQQLEQKDKRIQELEEYISIAPNLDEMTATKYINIQREAYIRGKAEEQQRAEQIIYENYIPKQVVIDLIANETIDISGFECIAVEDLEKIIGG